jgi:NTP pyrophosphatase (non-canonical NTP hydrolase)
MKSECENQSEGAVASGDGLADSPTWPYVLAFAKRMEAKLAKNRHKGDRAGWLKDHPWNLVERILDETVEVQQCFKELPTGDIMLAKTPEETADECADVANFCMMVADSVTKSANDQMRNRHPESATTKKDEENE